MKEELLDRFRHSHSFGQDQKRPGEIRTLIVIAITITMMVVEIIAGIVYGSMALLADGLHMASHAVALGINAFAYIYARKHAHNMRYSFGTGKVNTLGGYTGAVLLALFAAMMTWESVQRLLDPVSIAFNQAILVAVIGLLVNGVSVFILGEDHKHDHETDSDHSHKHKHDHHHDYNLKSAYLHVMADALTSVLAILALLIGKYSGAIWVDPLMGIVGAMLIARWSIGLLRNTSAILLDEQASTTMQERMREILEQDENNRVVDLHVWTVGPNIHAAAIAIVSSDPKLPNFYKRLLNEHMHFNHITIEVHDYNDAQG